MLLLPLLGCANSAISPEARQPQYPDNWQRDGDLGAVSDNWVAEFPDDSLNGLIDEALRSNYDLASQAMNVEVAAQDKRLARAARYPQLNLSLRESRDQTNPFEGIAFDTREVVSIAADLSFELDIWGRLAASEKSAYLNLLSVQTQYEGARRTLAANTARQWYNAIEAKQLLSLFQNRLENLSQSADIVESGYRQGINEALDVFLAQNTVEQQQANVANQQQLLLENVGNLQQLLARYPDGSMEVSTQLPEIETDIPAGLPSELITRRADVQSAWFTLLAADANLAVNHKARFPRLALTGRASDTTEQLDDLLEDGVTAWSLVLNLSRPLFDGGRLATLEKQARSRVEQAEKLYLATLYNAFSEVENGISRNALLKDQLNAFQKAEQNADAAFDLAFEQYQRGLVNYTTVLESQRQAFDAQTTVVRLKNQLLQNRIGLFLSLGGTFEVTQ